MSNSNTITPGMWRIILYVLLAQAGLVMFNNLSWELFDFEDMTYLAIYPNSTAEKLTSLLGILGGITLASRAKGFRQGLLIGFGLQFIGLLLVFVLGSFKLVWLFSFLIFYAGFTLILIKSWTRFNIYFPWATQAKVLAFMLLGTVIPVGTTVVEILYWPLLIFDGIGIQYITYLIGLLAVIIGVWLSLNDSLNEFYLPEQDIEEKQAIFWELPLGLLILSFLCWLGISAFYTPTYSNPNWMGDNVYLYAFIFSLVPLIVALLFYRWYRQANSTGTPLFWLWVALSIEVVFLLIVWLTPNLDWMIGSLFDLIHDYFILMVIQPLLAVLLFHRLPFSSHWWFGGLIAMTILGPIAAEWFINHKGILILGLLITFGPLIIGIRENRATLRERFQLDEAAFELEGPEDNPLDNLTDHLIDD